MDETDPLDLPALRERLSGEEGPALWRSLEELAEEPRMQRRLKRDYPDLAALGGLDRRTLLQLLAASLALPALAACDRGQVVTGAPLLSQPTRHPLVTPGVPLVFATTLEREGYGLGALARVQEGLANKIDGNPLHPATLGATDAAMQAAVLSLYDPDRSAAPTEGGRDIGWEDVARVFASLGEEVEARRGAGLHVLMRPLASPTVARLVAAVRRRLPEIRFHRHSPLGDEGAREGAVAAFGRPLDAVYDLRRADAVLSLGGDLFAEGPGHLRYAADHQARRREAGRPLQRLIAVETAPSLFGAKADERIPLPPSAVHRFALAVAAELGPAGPAGDAHPAAARTARALRDAGEGALVAAGREQPAALHALAHAINARIGAPGRTVRLIEPVRGDDGEGLAGLAEALAAGRVATLLVLDANPAYDAPADLDLPRLLAAAPRTVHLGFHRDETAALCRWHLPLCHELEAFGDLGAYDGTVGLRQPVVARRHRSLSIEEALAGLAGEPGEGRAILSRTWADRTADELARALEAGLFPDTASAPVAASLRADWRPEPPPAPAPSGLEVAFRPDPHLGAGRDANNAWLQELPKPFTKQVWGNAALIAPQTAATLGVAAGDVVEIASGGRRLRAPVLPTPGHAPGALTLPLGYGRRLAGRMGSHVGFDAFRLRTTERPWQVGGAAVARTGERVRIITTQEHHALDRQERDIIRVVEPGEAPTPPPADPPSFYPEWDYPGHAWGMAIDLDACIGCNACVVACQAENNVPAVGPEEVARGREMHWLRIDRYYAGAPADPQTFFQPVLCMQCEKAPCEVVCPVNATVHSSEGLNDMVYNRCIGTRTCSNNCPYKVRRFNFLDYQSGPRATPHEVLNPAVTVRSRGVMEKCTYCVQRISRARIEARIEERPLRDGEIATACQEACPTRAIVFGDLNDPGAAVTRLSRDPRSYALLGELNTQPRTSYLARVKARGPSDG